MDGIKITYWAFDALFNSMKEQLRQEYKSMGKENKFPEKITNLIGHPAKKTPAVNNKNKLPNLTDSIRRHPRVMNYLESWGLDEKAVSNFKIYDLVQRMTKAIKRDDKIMEEMDLPGVYSKIFFLYLGFDGYEEFRKELKMGRFTGYYYSLNRKKVDEFQLEILIYNAQATAQIHGFHDFDKTTPLIGKMTQVNQCWIAQLQSNFFVISLQLHMHDLGRGADKLLEARQLFGLVSGIGSEQNLVAGECIFVREDIEMTRTDVKRYLSLRRFFVKVKASLANISAEKELEFDFLSIDKLDHLADKSYRLIALLPDGSISQSKFKIGKDYSSTLQINDVDSPLPCTFFPDNLNGGTLVVQSYRKTAIYSTFVINLRPIAVKDSMYKGAFCVAGGENGSDPFGGRFIMMKDSDDFQPRIVKQSEKVKVFNTRPLKALLKELDNFSHKAQKRL